MLNQINESLIKLGEAYNVRHYSDILFDMIEDGMVDAKQIAEDLIYWCSEDDIEHYMRVNDLMFDDEEELDEAKDIPTKKGTVANILAQNMKSFKNINDVNELKNRVIDVIKNSDIKDKNGAKQFLFKLNKCYNKNAVLSTIASYMTGIKTGDVYK